MPPKYCRPDFDSMEVLIVWVLFTSLKINFHQQSVLELSMCNRVYIIKLSHMFKCLY